MVESFLGWIYSGVGRIWRSELTHYLVVITFQIDRSGKMSEVMSGRRVRGDKVLWWTSCQSAGVDKTL